ncbi:hypothetical protein PRIPAC_93848, partial [Pristionchus pacificus]|uniref:Uncharacterized protein n=1 Tax=Pristionchus pacificus TaxID=54126 RepID=A0A2A6BQN0_PRIPA
MEEEQCRKDLGRKGEGLCAMGTRGKRAVESKREIGSVNKLNGAEKEMEGSIQDISQKDNEKRANLIITGVDGGEGDRWRSVIFLCKRVQGLQIGRMSEKRRERRSQR